MSNAGHKRLKILIGCYSCCPNRGSEPGMGWNFVSNIAKHHDVHVLVNQFEFEEPLTQYCKTFPEEVKHITFHFIPSAYHETIRKIWPPSYYWFYRAWQKRAYRYAVELDKIENFDLVHQVNLAGYREPGYLWKLGKPYVIGPLGGFTQTAWRLLPGLGLHGAVFYGLRNIMNSWQKRMGFAAKTLPIHAKSIIVSDPEAVKDVQHIWKRDSILMREVGTPATVNPNDYAPARRTDSAPLRICWAGLLEPRKALQFLLHAIHLCTFSITVDVLGSGPQLKKWQSLVSKLGINHSVNFRGHVSHDEVLKYMKKSHLFCFTSIHEGGTGTVVLEALQHGLPIVCLDHCGFSSVVNEHCGIKIPITNSSEISKNFAKALDFLYHNEDRRFQMAQQAIQESKKYTWEAKMEVLNSIYNKSLCDK